MPSETLPRNLEPIPPSGIGEAGEDLHRYSFAEAGKTLRLSRVRQPA